MGMQTQMLGSRAGVGLGLGGGGIQGTRHEGWCYEMATRES